MPSPSIQKKLATIKAPLIKFYEDNGYNQTAGYLNFALSKISNGSELQFYVDVLSAMETDQVEDSALADDMQKQVMKIRQLLEAKRLLINAAKKAGIDMEVVQDQVNRTEQRLIKDINDAKGLDAKIAVLKNFRQKVKADLKREGIAVPPLRSDRDAQTTKSKGSAPRPSSWSEEYVENPLMAFFGTFMGLIKPLLDGSIQKSSNIQGEMSKMAPKLVAGVLGGFLGMFMPKKYRKQIATVLEPVINTDEPFTGLADYFAKNDAKETAQGSEMNFAQVLNAAQPLVSAFSQFISEQNKPKEQSRASRTQAAARNNDFFKPF